MGKPIYITDPVVAAAYHVHPGEFAYVASDAEAAWLVANHHGYGLNYATPLPAAYYVHAAAPLPFVPYVAGGPAPAPIPPAPAPEPSPAPAPEPAPAPTPTQQTINVGAEDTVTRIDVDGDGRADVLVVVDRPPQNP